MNELLSLVAIPQSVRVINLAGEPLRTDLVRRIYESTSVRKVHDLYGPTNARPIQRGHVGRLMVRKPSADP